MSLPLMVIFLLTPKSNNLFFWQSCRKKWIRQVMLPSWFPSISTSCQLIRLKSNSRECLMPYLEVLLLGLQNCWYQVSRNPILIFIAASVIIYIKSKVICFLSGYMLLFASPLTNKMALFDNAPLIALIGTTSLGKTQTSMMLINHFSDKVIFAFLTTNNLFIELIYTCELFWLSLSMCYIQNYPFLICILTH